jgi:hypothetical protein
MRVKCNFCGMRYVPEENDNQCPNCGGLYIKDADNQYGDIHDNISGDIHDDIRDNGDIDDDEPSWGERPSAEDMIRQEVKVAALDKFFRVLMIAIIIIVGIVGSGDLLDKKTDYDHLKQKSEAYVDSMNIPTEVLSVDDAVECYSEKYGNLVIHINSLQKRGAEVKLPHGYVLMELSYTLDIDGKESGDYIYGLNIEPYILTKSGSYIQSVPYDYEELLGISSERADKEGIDNDFSYTEGKIYYVMREDDVDKIALYFEETEGSYDVVGIEKIIYLEVE